MNRPTLIAIGVFAALLIAFVATREKSVSVGVQKLEVPALAVDSITRIEVKGANAALLEKSANGWTVADPAKAEVKYAADDAQVQTALTAVAEFKAADFVSDKADKQGEFEVDSTKGTTVKVTGGPKTLEIVLGKASKSGGTYVRKEGANAVFSTNSPLSYQMKRNVTAWRKKSIVTAPVADITGLTVTRADGSGYALKTVEGGGWALASAAPKGFRFDAQAASRVVNQLASLLAQDFTTDAVDFSKATTFAVALKDGKNASVKLASDKRPDGTVPLMVEGDSQVYLLASWTAEQLDKKLDDLRDLSLLAFEPDKVTKVSIVAGAKKTVVAKDASGWKLVEPKTPPPDFDSNQVTNQVMRLKSLRATKLATDTTKAGLAAPSATIEVVADGKTSRVVFGADAPNSEVFVKGTVDDLVYLIASGEKTAWLQGAELFKKPPPPPDFNHMQGLEQLPPDVRQKLMQQLRQQQRN
jgi:hypothetical protein